MDKKEITGEEFIERMKELEKKEISGEEFIARMKQEPKEPTIDNMELLLKQPQDIIPQPDTPMASAMQPQPLQQPIVEKPIEEQREITGDELIARIKDPEGFAQGQFLRKQVDQMRELRTKDLILRHPEELLSEDKLTREDVDEWLKIANEPAKAIEKGWKSIYDLLTNSPFCEGLKKAEFDALALNLAGDLNIPLEEAQQASPESLAEHDLAKPGGVARGVVRELPGFLAESAIDFTEDIYKPENLVLMFAPELVWSKLAKVKVGSKTLSQTVKTINNYTTLHTPLWFKRAFSWMGGVPDKDKLHSLVSKRSWEIKESYRLANERNIILNKNGTIESQELVYDWLTSGELVKTKAGRDALFFDENHVATGLALRKAERALQRGIIDEKDYASIVKLWNEIRPTELMKKRRLELLKKAGVENPKKYLQDATKARKAIDELTEVYIDEGLKSGFLTDKAATLFRGNKGKYMRRLYEIFENPKLAEEIAGGRITIEQAMDIVGGIDEFLRKKLKYREAGVAAFKALPPASQQKILDQAQSGIKIEKVSTLPLRIKNYLFKKRKDLPEVRREAMGEIKEVGYVVGKTMHAMGERIASEKFFRLISEDTKWVSPVAKEGWKYVKNENMGVLKGKWVHPAVEAEISQTLATPSLFNKVWLPVLSAWKAGKVLAYPGTHMRNMIFNVVAGDAQGFPLWTQPFYLAAATKEILKKGQLYKKLSKVDYIGGRQGWAGAEIERPFEVKDIKRVTETLWETTKKVITSPIRVLAKAYTSEEEIFKMAFYMHARNARKLSFKEAIQGGESAYFNYGKISTATKFLRENPVYTIPFLTFPIKAIPMLLDVAIKDPFKLYKYHMMINSMNETAREKHGISKEQLDAYTNYGGYGVLLPGKYEDGTPMFAHLDYFFPWFEIRKMVEGKQFKKVNKWFPDFLSAGGPISILQELHHNRALFTGKDIVDSIDPKGEQLRQQSYYLQKGMMPSLFPTLTWGSEKTNVPRLLPKLQLLMDAVAAHGYLSEETEKEWKLHKYDKDKRLNSIPLALSDILLGVKITSFNPQELKNWDLKAIESAANRVEAVSCPVLRNKGRTQEEIEIHKHRIRQRRDLIIKAAELAKSIGEPQSDIEDDSKDEITKKTISDFLNSVRER